MTIRIIIKDMKSRNTIGIRCNNKGVALVACLLVLVPLMILSSAFFARSISEKNLIQIQQHRTQAFYFAQRGLNYAYFEIAHHPFIDWFTHEVQGNDATYALIPRQNPPQVFLSTCHINAEGNYAPLNPATSGNFTVRVFPDPFKRDESIILSRGVSGPASFIMYQRVNTASLYKYFIFTPNNLILDNTTYDGGSLRRWIHANGDVVFRENAVMTNMDRVDTHLAFRYDYITYVPPDDTSPTIPPNAWGNVYTNPPVFNSWGGDDITDSPIVNNPVNPDSTPAVFWQYRWPWYVPWTNDTIVPISYPVINILPDGHPNQHYYYNNPDGHLYGDSWVPQDQEPHTSAPQGHPPYLAVVNSAEIKNRLQPGFAYQIPNKYLALPQEAQQAQCQPGPGAPINITYLKSTEQPIAWRNFLNQSNLDGILNDASDGVEERVPLQLNLYKFASHDEGFIAENGMYIQYENGVPNVHLNGDFVPQSQWSAFLGHDASFMNTNSGHTDDIFLLDVAAMMDLSVNPSGPPQNGMIFCTKDLLVYNAGEVPEGGLLIVSLGNIYFRGDFNVTDWQPCVAMSPKFFYFLSNNFNVNSLPHAARATLHNPQWPYANPPYEARSDWGSGYNWVALQNNNMPNTVALKPGSEPYRYNISLIGPHVFNPGPQYLERWKYYTNPGTGPPSYNPPVLSSEVQQPIEFRGNFVVLPVDNFLPNFQYGWINANIGTIQPYSPNDPNFTGGLDWSAVRHDNFGGDRDLINHPGWPVNMTSIGPSTAAKKRYIYEDRYFNFPLNQGTPELPPDEGLSFRRGAWMEVGDFNHFNILTSKIESEYLGPIIPLPE